MSILSDLLGDLEALLFPPHCAVCGTPLTEGERAVCTCCRLTAPLTGFWREADNALLRKCRDRLPVVRASAMLFFVGGSGWREAIHSFKYRGRRDLALTLGRWYGSLLRREGAGLYDDLDVIVPLPLHPFKLCSRGYNQSEYIARGIASQLGVRIDRHSVRRIRNTSPQALRPRSERPANVEGAFAVRRPERLDGRHVMLVDDVMTTGSTLLACAEAILRAAPSCRISIAVLAVPRHETGIER